MTKPKDAPGPGHNSVAGPQLRAFIERVERLEEEKAERSADIKEVYSEAKGQGYNAKALRKIVWRRKQDANKLAAEEEDVDLYLAALGML